MKTKLLIKFKDQNNILPFFFPRCKIWVLWARLVDYNRHCNVIDIPIVSLFGCLVMFLLQWIAILQNEE